MLAQLAICYKVSLQLYSSELHWCSGNYISSLIFLFKILFSVLRFIYLQLFSWFLFVIFFIFDFIIFFILHYRQTETSSFHLSILWFMINLVPLAWHLLQQAVFLQAPPWLMYNLWYLPLASRITKFKAPLEPKEPCRGAEGLQSPWGDWQGNSSVSLQEFSHKSMHADIMSLKLWILRIWNKRRKWLKCICTLK